MTQNAQEEYIDFKLKTQHVLAMRETSIRELERTMKRYTRFVLRFNEKLNDDSPEGLKEYGLPNVCIDIGQNGNMNPDVPYALIRAMENYLRVPDIPFTPGAECWFTEEGWKLLADELWDLIIEAMRRGYTPCMYHSPDFPPDSIIYADEYQIVIDRDKLR